MSVFRTRTEGKKHQKHDHDQADHQVIRNERRFVLHTTGGLDRGVLVLRERERWDQRKAQQERSNHGAAPQVGTASKSETGARGELAAQAVACVLLEEMAASRV